MTGTRCLKEVCQFFYIPDLKLYIREDLTDILKSAVFQVVQNDLSCLYHCAGNHFCAVCFSLR